MTYLTRLAAFPVPTENAANLIMCPVTVLPVQKLRSSL